MSFVLLFPFVASLRSANACGSKELIFTCLNGMTEVIPCYVWMALKNDACARVKVNGIWHCRLCCCLFFVASLRCANACGSEELIFCVPDGTTKRSPVTCAMCLRNEVAKELKVNRIWHCRFVLLFVFCCFAPRCANACGSKELIVCVPDGTTEVIPCYVWMALKNDGSSLSQPDLPLSFVFLFVFVASRAKCLRQRGIDLFLPDGMTEVIPCYVWMALRMRLRESQSQRVW